MSDQSAITTTSSKSVYSSIQSFESAQRIAASLADSALVPNAYRGQQGLPNCIVAIEIANRMGMSPFPGDAEPQCDSWPPQLEQSVHYWLDPRLWSV